MSNFKTFPVILVALLLLPSIAIAQWQVDGSPVCTNTNEQVRVVAVSDGAGGAIVVWRDNRNGNYDIYAQRINAAGVALWVPDGIVLSTAAGDQDLAVVAEDGAGGAIATWVSVPVPGVSDIYAQRINAGGVVQWAANGVVVCGASGVQWNPAIVADANGAVVIAWEDSRSGPADIYAQRINGAGVGQWASNGVAMCTASSIQVNPSVVSDGSGGVIASWEDYRNLDANVYAQRLNGAGAVQWVADGIAICTASNNQFWPEIVPDGAGGAIAAWIDSRLGFGSDDIYAQRISGSGTAQWAINGVIVCDAVGLQSLYLSGTLLADGSGGAIMTWHDSRLGPNNIFVQRVNASGTSLWTPDGVALCLDPGGQGYPYLISNGSGGAIVTWHDARTGGLDVYAQHVSSAGATLWETNGTPIAATVGNQGFPVLVSDGQGAAVVAFTDNRFGNEDVFAQRFDSRHGYWGRPDPGMVSVADIRGDQGGKVKVNWNASDQDAFDLQEITHYSVWRATDEASALAMLTNGMVVRSPSELPRDFGGNAVWKQHAPSVDYYWEWVGSQDAHYRENYTFSAATRSDSTSLDDADAYFFVSAHTSDPFVFFDSGVGSGHSVDNLAPPAPLMLTAQRVGRDVELRWNRAAAPDVRDYSVYRASASGVTPVPLNFLAMSEDTVLVDVNTPVSVLHYIVTATDVHANKSTPSNEASVQKLTGIGDAPALTTLTVRQNYPNPFAGTTELSIGLPRESDVSIEIYDVAGRIVRNQRVPRMSAGWQRIAFDGHGSDGKPLASGVYFYRVRASGSTITKKMVITR